jgi:hypothetical protein
LQGNFPANLDKIELLVADAEPLERANALIDAF